MTRDRKLDYNCATAIRRWCRNRATSPIEFMADMSAKHRYPGREMELILLFWALSVGNAHARMAGLLAKILL